jgi:DNA-binding GntR family transcriptional regulator
MVAPSSTPERPAPSRAPLRERVHRTLVERMLREELKPGSRISDTALSRELGVSRTPIREALLRLEREGFLASDLGRGFSVKPLCLTEVEESYPILWTLEVLALRTAGAPDRARLRALRATNARLEAEPRPERRIDLDTAWHRLLVEGCGNGALLAMIDDLKRVIRRYEYAYMQNAGHAPLSTLTHARILERLEEGDVEGALPLLVGNWEATRDSLSAWLREVV